MFQKILIANRGESRRAAAASAQTHAGLVARVMSEPNRRSSKARGD
jgi:acetyl/propionyl-CoA carboxylase alpha subunit